MSYLFSNAVVVKPQVGSDRIGYASYPAPVVEEKKSLSEEDVQKVLTAVKASSAMVMRMGKGSKGKLGSGKNSGLKLTLFLPAYNKVSAANTSLSDATYMTANNAALFSSAANLFDEYRCTGGTIRFSVVVSAASSTVPILGVVGYDAYDTGAPSSVAIGANNLYKRIVTLTTTGESALSAKANGQWIVKFKLPKEASLDTAAGSVPSSSQWVASSTTMGVGVVQTFMEGVAAAGIVSVRYLISLDLEFRCRR